MENMVEKTKFWKNKKVLLTGFNGFKGSWMTLILSQLGAKVYGYSLNNKVEKRNNKIFSLEKNCYKFFYGNILDFNSLKKFFNISKPDIIIHMASQALVYNSFEDPKKTFEINSSGLNNILSLALKSKKKISSLILTSDKCYYNNETKRKFSEDDKLLGEDPYSASKSIQEIIAYSYMKSFGLNIATARAGNVIGGGDYSKFRIIPDIIRSIFEKKTLVIRNIKSTRPWQHVLDINLNYIKFIEKFYYDKNLSGPWNFGPDKSYDVEKIVNFFKSKKYFKTKISKDKKFEKKYLQLSNKKLKSNLKIKNSFDINKSLELTYDWYSECFTKDKEKIYKYSMMQVKNFLKHYYFKN